jgi:tRNA-specific 2-thiouridylase
MTVRAVALLSGGLDSMLAIRVLQLQGIEVEALNFRTKFACCQSQAAQAADELGVQLSVLAERDDYLEVIRNPQHGYGRGANPCVDCRIYMFRLAAQRMRDTGAAFVVSGEIVGQRPMSQKKRDLAVIAHRAGLTDHLLRPLCAKLLPPTAPEREGLVDRERLFGFSGRGRKELIALAKQFGFTRIPQPSTGCALTEPQFGAKVHDLLDHDPAAVAWDFDLLKIGRHIRLDAVTKVIVGRRAEENEQLVRLFEQRRSELTMLVSPENFIGPTALVVSTTAPPDEDALRAAGGLILRYAGGEKLGPTATVRHDNKTSVVALHQVEQTSATI